MAVGVSLVEMKCWPWAGFGAVITKEEKFVEVSEATLFNIFFQMGYRSKIIDHQRDQSGYLEFIGSLLDWVVIIAMSACSRSTSRKYGIRGACYKCGCHSHWSKAKSIGVREFGCLDYPNSKRHFILLNNQLRCSMHRDQGGSEAKKESSILHKYNNTGIDKNQHTHSGTAS